MSAHLTNEPRQLAWRLRNKGWSLRSIAKEVGCSYPGIRASLLGRPRAARPDLWVPAKGRLSVHEREEILLGLHRGESMRSIARSLNRSPSTVTREVGANGGRECYRIWPAHQRARLCTKRPKATTFDVGLPPSLSHADLSRRSNLSLANSELRRPRIADPALALGAIALSSIEEYSGGHHSRTSVNSFY